MITFLCISILVVFLLKISASPFLIFLLLPLFILCSGVEGSADIRKRKRKWVKNYLDSICQNENKKWKKEEILKFEIFRDTANVEIADLKLTKEEFQNYKDC